MRELTDAELIERWRLGDSRAFTLLYARHTPRLKAFLWRYLRDAEEIRDLVQETWARVAAWTDLASHGNFFAALCTIAKYRAITEMQRREVRERYAPLLEASGIQGAKPAPAAKPKPRPKRSLAGQITIARWNLRRKGYVIDEDGRVRRV
jgi:DNA-directed RNA polymerase specialized sigma24 family protein